MFMILRVIKRVFLREILPQTQRDRYRRLPSLDGEHGGTVFFSSICYGRRKSEGRWKKFSSNLLLAR